ncbi:MAG: hypothetical protein A3G23_07080 [Bacteroidetes bacterium RIFCSPLOWO2_12_FULL_37_12]|nr:MAG: hypothetical protein A3G23_07080 [Bacteroidetes bacterium RIFCSPLOWO2_12_FULL_37_12]
METVLIVLLLISLLFIGARLFVIIGAVTLLLFFMYCDLPMFSLIKSMFDMLNKSAFLAIPLYVFAGAIMAKGEIARRLVELALALVGWMRGGLAVASVAACMLFASISGSSPVTLITIGSIMYPAMQKRNYPDHLSIGVISVAGSLGILIPPSIPMIIFSIVTGANINQLFLAGIIPGVITGILLMGVSVLLGLRFQSEVVPFSSTQLWVKFKRGLPALFMPLLVLGGIYSGIYTVTEAAAVAAVYALVMEYFVFKEMKVKDIVNTLYDSVIILGIIFIIIAMATAFNFFLTVEDVPMLLVDFLQSFVTNRVQFLLITILLLLIVGLFMDIISAILILAPLLLPTALAFDVDPVQLGLIFIVGLEIGYLTPPIGINLFVASALFNKPFGKVVSASLIFTFCLLITLFLVAFFPQFAKI